MSQPTFQQFCAWGFDHPSLVEQLGVGEIAPEGLLEKIAASDLTDDGVDHLPKLLGRLECRSLNLSGANSANEEFVKTAYSLLCGKQQEIADEPPAIEATEEQSIEN